MKIATCFAFYEFRTLFVIIINYAYFAYLLSCDENAVDWWAGATPAYVDQLDGLDWWHCPKCGPSQTGSEGHTHVLQYQYELLLLLKDKTGSVSVHLSGQDAVSSTMTSECYVRLALWYALNVVNIKISVCRYVPVTSCETIRGLTINWYTGLLWCAGQALLIAIQFYATIMVLSCFW